MNTPKEDNFYRRYRELGGIINEKDYESALARTKNRQAPDLMLIRQAERIAEFAGIKLHNPKNSLDQRIILYAILRADIGPKELKYHHDQMSDQGLFAEVLRMLGDADSLDKLMSAYPHISF